VSDSVFTKDISRFFSGELRGNSISIPISEALVAKAREVLQT